MTYQESIDWLYGTQDFGIKLGLEAPRRLLREFLAFPSSGTKVIHVAGTNGKGSTCAILDSLARASAIKSGLFTSPHLVHYRERAQVNGLPISEKKTARLLDELKNLVADWDHHPTFFELTLALAMRHFRDEKCELIILETGMGGRLDATSAVPADLAILTPIALDHAKWLGDSIEEIAAEKAAIAVSKKPLLSSAQDPAAQYVIEQEANEKRSPLTFVTEPLLGYTVNLPGPHQRHNAALACEAFCQAGYALTYDLVVNAMATVRWPGRFEIITGPDRAAPLVLDAAHNPHAALALRDTWQEFFPKEKTTLIFGAVADKDVKAVLKTLAPLSETIHFVPVPSPRSLAPEDLAKLLPENTSHTSHPDLETALQATAADKTPTLLTGSLFLLGQAKALLENDFTYKSTSQ